MPIFGKKLKKLLVYSHASVRKVSEWPTRIFPPMDGRIPPTEIVGSQAPEMLQRRVMEQAEWKILPEAIHLIANGKVHVENGHAFIENL